MIMRKDYSLRQAVVKTQRPGNFPKCSKYIPPNFNRVRELLFKRYKSLLKRFHPVRRRDEKA